MIIYPYLEFFLLLVLTIRIYIYSRVNFDVVRSNFEIFLYLLAVFTNSLLCIIFGETKSITIAFDVIFPMTIIIPILARKNSKLYLFLLLGFILISYFALVPTQNIIRYFLYLFCMTILFMYSIKLALGSGKELKKSPMYLLLALDFLITTILQQLYGLKINWEDSQYVGFVGIVVLSFYLINLILANVYIRRFFIN